MRAACKGKIMQQLSYSFTGTLQETVGRTRIYEAVKMGSERDKHVVYFQLQCIHAPIQLYARKGALAATVCV